jgi:hypothetical protein
MTIGIFLCRRMNDFAPSDSTDSLQVKVETNLHFSSNSTVHRPAGPMASVSELAPDSKSPDEEIDVHSFALSNEIGYSGRIWTLEVSIKFAL